MKSGGKCQVAREQLQKWHPEQHFTVELFNDLDDDILDDKPLAERYGDLNNITDDAMADEFDEILDDLNEIVLD